MENNNDKKSFGTRIKNFFNIKGTRLGAGALAFVMVASAAYNSFSEREKDRIKDLEPTEPGMTDYDHDHDHDHDREHTDDTQKVQNIEIEIRPGVVVEVDGSLFPNVDNLDNDEIKAILDDLEKENEKLGKDPIVDPSLREPESQKPNRPAVTKPEKGHEHLFGDWDSYDDEVEARFCECGEMETRPHDYSVTKTSYATYSDGTHYEVDTKICDECGHKFVEAHKENCELHFQGYDENFEYHHCDECGYTDEVEHNLDVESIDGYMMTMACQNEGCAYTKVIDMTPGHNVGIPDFGPDIPGIIHHHDWSGWSSLNDNLEISFCKSCGKAMTRNHDYKTTSTTYENQGDAGHVRITNDVCQHEECGHERTITSQIIGHNIRTTENSDGSITYTCGQTGCNYTKTIKPIEHTTHNWVETGRTVGTPANDSQHNSMINYTCTIGGEIRTERTLVDCTMTSSTSVAQYDDEYHWTETTGSCICGNSLKHVTEKAPHGYTTITTYENKGESGHIAKTEKSCACGHKVNSTGQLMGHTLDEGTTNADGSITYKCTATGCSYTKVDQKEHTQHDWKEIGRRTPTPDGSSSHKITIDYQCSVCHENKSEEKIESCVAKPGTGTSVTKSDSEYHWTETSGVCTCGNNVISISNKVLHTYGAWEKINDQEEKRTCSGCGHSETRNITHEHSWIETNRTVGSSVGDSSHYVTISYKCSGCTETKTETKTEACTMTSTGVSIPKYDSTGHWTESQVKCACGNTKNEKSAVSPHSMTESQTGSPVQYNENQHRIPTVEKCSCGYSSTPKYTYADHSWTENDKETYIEYTCSCGARKEVQKEQHGDHTYRNDGSKDNGDGTHTTTYTCTNTKGTCNARTYTSVAEHSYVAREDGDMIFYKCACGASYSVDIDDPKPAPEPEHSHSWRNDGSHDNGDGTHTTSFTCTSTVGDCDQHTKTETSGHSYSSRQDGDMIFYKCACGASYSVDIDEVEEMDSSVASITSYSSPSYTTQLSSDGTQNDQGDAYSIKRR